MAFTLEESYTPGNTATGFTLPTVAGPFNLTKRAQVFTAGSSYTLARVGLRLGASSQPKNCLVAIYSTSGGVPLSLLTSATMTIDGVDPWKYVEFSSPISINSGTQYAIVSEAPVSGTTNTQFHTGTAPTEYPSGGPYLYNSNGPLWIAGTVTQDHPFKTYSELLVPTKPTNPTPTDIGTGIVLLPTLSWEAG